MKKNILKSIGSVLLIVLVYFGYSLFQESPEEFATKYITGYMEATYHNKNDLYLETTGSTDSEADLIYEDSILYEAETFITAFELTDITDEQYSRLCDLFELVYKKTKFTVEDAKEIKTNTYNVDVVISPLNIIKLVNDELLHLIDNSSEDELYQINDNWNNSILDILDKNIDNIDYLEKETVSVEVTKDSNEIYDFSDDFVFEINYYMITYDYE